MMKWLSEMKKKSWSSWDLKYLKIILITSEKKVSSFSIILFSHTYNKYSKVKTVLHFVLTQRHVPFCKMVAFMTQHEKGLSFSPVE